jgi:hypothetical protein
MTYLAIYIDNINFFRRKIKIMDHQKSTKILTQKLNYLVKMASKDQFDIIDLSLDFHGSPDLLDGYTIFIECDYLWPWVPTPLEFSSQLIEITKMITDYLNMYVITKDFKLVKNDKGIVSDSPIIASIEFELEERHVMTMSFGFDAA